MVIMLENPDFALHLYVYVRDDPIWWFEPLVARLVKFNSSAYRWLERKLHFQNFNTREIFLIANLSNSQKINTTKLCALNSKIDFYTFSIILIVNSASQVHVHSTYESLYERIPKSILPADYGGEEMQIDDLASKLSQLLSAW